MLHICYVSKQCSCVAMAERKFQSRTKHPAEGTSACSACPFP